MYFQVCTAGIGRQLYYNNIVALPMSVSTVLTRLKEGYYTHLCAVAFDAHLIASNAATFNGSRSLVARMGKGASSTSLQLRKHDLLQHHPTYWPSRSREVCILKGVLGKIWKGNHLQGRIHSSNSQSGTSKASKLQADLQAHGLICSGSFPKLCDTFGFLLLM